MRRLRPLTTRSVSVRPCSVHLVRLSDSQMARWSSETMVAPSTIRHGPIPTPVQRVGGGAATATAPSEPAATASAHPAATASEAAAAAVTNWSPPPALPDSTSSGGGEASVEGADGGGAPPVSPADYLQRAPASDQGTPYTLITDVGRDDPQLLRRPNLMGVIASVPEAGRQTTRGRYMAMVVIKDPSCDAADASRNDILLFAFLKNSHEVLDVVRNGGLVPGTILRVRGAKIERHNNKLDGRVFSAYQLTAFAREVGSPLEPLGGPRPSLTEAERARVKWLRNWWRSLQILQPALDAAEDTTLGGLSQPGLFNLSCEAVCLVSAAVSGAATYIVIRDGTRCAVPFHVPRFDPEQPNSPPMQLPETQEGSETQTQVLRDGAVAVHVRVLDSGCLNSLQQLQEAGRLRYVQLQRLRASPALQLQDAVWYGLQLGLCPDDGPTVLELPEASLEVAELDRRLREAGPQPAAAVSGTGIFQLPLTAEKAVQTDGEGIWGDVGVAAGSDTAGVGVGRRGDSATHQPPSAQPPAVTSPSAESQESRSTYAVEQEELESPKSCSQSSYDAGPLASSEQVPVPAARPGSDPLGAAVEVAGAADPDQRQAARSSEPAAPLSDYSAERGHSGPRVAQSRGSRGVELFVTPSSSPCADKGESFVTAPQTPEVSVLDCEAGQQDDVSSSSTYFEECTPPEMELSASAQHSKTGGGVTTSPTGSCIQPLTADSSSAASSWGTPVSARRPLRRRPVSAIQSSDSMDSSGRDRDAADASAGSAPAVAAATVANPAETASAGVAAVTASPTLRFVPFGQLAEAPAGLPVRTRCRLRVVNPAAGAGQRELRQLLTATCHRCDTQYQGGAVPPGRDCPRCGTSLPVTLTLRLRLSLAGAEVAAFVTGPPLARFLGVAATEPGCDRVWERVRRLVTALERPVAGMVGLVPCQLPPGGDGGAAARGYVVVETWLQPMV